MPYDQAAMAAKKAEIENRQGGGDRPKTKYYKVKALPEINKLRIIPGFDQEDFYIERWVCFKVGPNKKKIIVKDLNDSPALSKHINELREASKSGDKQAEEELKECKPTRKTFMFVIDRTNEKEGPQLFEATDRTFRGILTYAADPEYGDISHPETGFDLKIELNKKTANGIPEYAVGANRKESALGTPEQIAEWTKESLFQTQGKFIYDGADEDYIVKVINGEDTRSNNSNAGPSSKVEFYIANADGESVPATSLDVQEAVEVAGDPKKVDVCKVGESDWKTAADFGFQVPTKAAAPLPPPPPRRSTPVVDNNVDDGIKGKLAALKAKREAKEGVTS